MINTQIGFFFDYDGVLSPVESERSRAYPSSDRLEMISYLRSIKVMVAVVSGKDCPFLMERGLNVDAIACVNGLEIRIPGYVVIDERVLNVSKQTEFSGFVSEVERVVGREAYVEKKRISLGPAIGISIDWRSKGGKPHKLREIMYLAEKSGFAVSYAAGEPFIDIHIVKSEKDLAVSFLRKIFDIKKVVYFGDSQRDLPAFKVSDVRVFVKHGSNEGIVLDLVDYTVSYDALSKWVMNYAGSLLT